MNQFENALIHFSNSDDQLARNREKESSTPLTDSNDKVKIEIPEDAFLMVTQMNWEDDVVWNGEDIKHKVSYNSPESFSTILDCFNM